jgi:hypothetical protein
MTAGKSRVAQWELSCDFLWKDFGESLEGGMLPPHAAYPWQAATERRPASTACGMPLAWQWHASGVSKWHAACRWQVTSRKWNRGGHSACQFGTANDTPLFSGGTPFLVPFSKRERLRPVMTCRQPQAREAACHTDMHHSNGMSCWHAARKCHRPVRYRAYLMQMACHMPDGNAPVACGVPAACQAQTSLEGS